MGSRIMLLSTFEVMWIIRSLEILWIDKVERVERKVNSKYSTTIVANNKLRNLNLN